ncbi:hypothetical protein H0H93_015253 [Arthromyces matolae]|nr:hypothetical protein H0H93_015253 [Arthromyces matolae]
MAFKITDAPNPSFTFGQKLDATAQGREWLEGEKEGWKTVDPATEEPVYGLSFLFGAIADVGACSKLYGLLVSGIVPRPIAFVSTVSEDGVANIGPFRGSSHIQVSNEPPVLSIACNTWKDPIREKDTTKNIKATKCFTVNIVSEAWIAQSNFASVDAPENFTEWPAAGLTMEPSTHIKAPRVKESAFSMECEVRNLYTSASINYQLTIQPKLLQTVDVVIPETGEVGTTLVLGLIKCIHVRKDVLDERGNVDPAKFKPVGRMGGTMYSTVNEGYHIPRPNWKADEAAIREVTNGAA